MSEQDQQIKKYCPRCGSSSVVRRGHRHAKSMVIPLFQCYGCGRSFSFIHAGYANCFRLKKGVPRLESHREPIRAGIKRFYDSHKGYIPVSAWKKGHIPFNKGKHLSEQHRRRDSESHMGHVGFFTGRHHSEEAKRKISIANRGKPSPRKGKHGCYSDETLMKLSIARKGSRHTEEAKRKMRDAMKDRHLTEEHKKKISTSIKAKWQDESFVRSLIKGLHSKPNTSEQFLDSLLQSILPNEFRYVGDGQVIMDRLCPDFINCNGKKQIIELFGEPFHDPLKTFKRPIGYRQTEKGRIEAFAKYGYSTLIIWQHELKQVNALKERIINFARGV